MRVSVEIDQKTLSQILLITGERKKSRAIAKAIQEFLRLMNDKACPGIITQSSTRLLRK